VLKVKITTLLENTTKDAALLPKHGLSIHIETPKHKILFDLGPDDTFLANAQKMGIDLAEVDTVVLSHGHYDHGGGLPGFLKINNKAKVYINPLAFEPYYAKLLFIKKYIGLDQNFAGNERIIFTSDTMQIDDELFIFSDVEGQFESKGNRSLFKKIPAGFARDDFAHEQNLIVTAKGTSVLFSGCSHKGIANILRAAYKYKPTIDAAFGGFHLYNPVKKSSEPTEVVEGLAAELSSLETVLYTGHCTGKQAYKTMRDIMGDKIRHLHTGAVIDI